MKSRYLLCGVLILVTLSICVAVVQFYRPAKNYVVAKLYWHFAYCTPYFDDNYLYLSADGSQALARVVVIPGNGESARFFAAVPLGSSWLRGLTAMHADVVVLNTFHPPGCWFDRDGGKDYRAKFLHELDEIMAEVSARHGSVRRIMISGVSFGGLHAMIGYAAHPERYVGWEADNSLTRLSAMIELAIVGDVPAFDPFYELSVLRNSQGFLTWGTKDTRVDHRLTESLYGLIRSPKVVSIAYPNMEHVWNEQHVRNLLVDAKRQIGP